MGCGLPLLAAGLRVTRAAHGVRELDPCILTQLQGREVGPGELLQELELEPEDVGSAPSSGVRSFAWGCGVMLREVTQVVFGLSPLLAFFLDKKSSL